MILLKRLLPLPILALACACGGGSHGPADATALVYTNPTDATSWRLVQDSASTAAHLVLDLVAPAGASGRGVTLALTTDPTRAGWSQVGGGAYAVQSLYPGPLVLVGSVEGASLRMVAAQTPGAPVVYGTTPVLQVALDLAAGTLPGAVALTAAQAGHLGASGAPAAVAVAVGALQSK